MRRVVQLTALGLAVAGSPTLAMAQTVPSADPTPLQARGFSASLTAADTYDSNVARSDAQIAALRHLTLSDQLFQPAATVDLVAPIDRQAVFFDGTLGYDYYQRNRVLNRQRVNVDGGVRGQVRTCTATLGGSYSQRQNSLEDITLALIKDTLTDTGVNFSATCKAQIGFSPFITASQDWETNSSTAIVSSNYRTTSANAGVAYAQPLIGEISVYGGYTKSLFPNREVPVGVTAEQDGYQIYTGGVRYDRKLGARIEGTVAFAYTSLKPNTNQTAPFKGATYQADVTYTPSGRLSLDVHASRAAQPTPLSNTAYNIQQLYSATANYRVGARGLFSLGVSDNVEDLRGALLLAGFNITHETTDSVYATGTYTLNRRLTLVMDVREEDRRANLSAFSYDDTRVTVTARSAF
jgi:hypothetical protein